MKKVNLGGNRLGSGNKINVDLHGYERSTHDLGYTWRNTMSPGTLVPFMSRIGLPGDTLEIDLATHIMTLPTVAPLFGSFKVQLDIFECPIRLYNSWLHNNKLKIGNDMSKVKFPIMELAADYVKDLGEKDNDYMNNLQINPSCILKYLGYSGVGINDIVDTTQTREFNSIPLLAYWDIYKNYYANKQEEKGAVIHRGTEEPTEIDKIYIKVESDPDEIGLYWTVQTIELEIGDKTGNSTFAGYYSIQQILFDATGSNPPNLKNVMIWTYGSNTPQSLDAWLSKVFTPDYALYWWYDNANNKWVLNTVISTQDIYNAGESPIWSYELNNDFSSDSSLEPRVVMFDLNNLDLMRETVLSHSGDNALNISNLDISPYNYVAGTNSGKAFRKQTQEGLAIKTYQSDIFNNWVRTEWVDEINNKTAISTSGGKFTIEQLNISKKLYDYYNRVAVSGGSYDDWIEATYDIEKLKTTEIPVYKGGLIRELSFEEVVSNSASDVNNNKQPIGTLAGKGVMTSKNKGGKVIIKCDEPCYIIGIISITTRIDYSQGNQFDIHLKSLEDLHNQHLTR